MAGGRDYAKFLRDMLKDPNDPQQFDRVMQSVVETVRKSFERDSAENRIVMPAALPNRDEIKRRANICYNWFVTMRGDCGFSTQRALDLLPDALKAALAGDQWEPPRSGDGGWTDGSAPVKCEVDASELPDLRSGTDG